MKTIYTPIAVSSGELPEHGSDFIGIDKHGIMHPYTNTSDKIFKIYSITHWLKKEEVPELTEEEINKAAISFVKEKYKIDSEIHLHNLIYKFTFNDLISDLVQFYSSKDELKVGDKTRYGIIEEFVEKDGVKMMRSNNPYGTWPIIEWEENMK